MNIFDFNLICQRTPLSICPALGINDPSCFARNINIGSWLIFQPATITVDISAIVMTTIMIYHIKSKYTAVGRKEMVIFFYWYLLDSLLDLLLVSNIIPFSSSVYKYVAAVNVGSICATCMSLMLNGFVGFQWAEDGTGASVWSIRILSTAWFAVGCAVALAAFLGIMGAFSKMLLFITLWFVNAGFLLIYVTSQVILVLIALDDRWSLGDLFFGAVFLLAGVAAAALSSELCGFAAHYLDGLFLSASMFLLAVMMTYKYWDSITHEDLEFTVITNHLWSLAKRQSKGTTNQ